MSATSYEAALDEEFLGHLRRFARRHSPSPQDAEDVLQDAFVKLLRKGGSVAGASARAWLFTVVRNEAIDRWRAVRRRGEQAPAAKAVVEADAEAVAYLAQCMAPMLALLPPEDCDVLQRVDVLGESQAGVARACGLSLSTVRSRVQRARKRLRDHLESCCIVERDGRGAPVDYRRREGGPCPCSSPGEFEARRVASKGGRR